MKKLLPFLGLSFSWASAVISTAGASDVENPLFGYTHLLPSPFTLPAGRLAFGTDVSLGVTDFLQVGTNILRDFYKVYNANGKVSVVDSPEFAMALTVGYESYNLKDVSVSNPDLRIHAWQPGLVMSNTVVPHVALFYGANLNLASPDLDTSGVLSSGYVTGARLESDLSWAYNPPTRKTASIGNVLSAGVSYDVNYKLVGFGVSHHWPGLHIGIHFYPNADQYRVQPILSGGTVIDL